MDSQPRQLDDLTPAAIKAAIPAVFPEDGHAEVRHVMWQVAELLGSGYDEVPQGYRGNAVRERHIGRVQRALDSLAADGVLIRVGGKDQPPDGTSPGGLSWWTPEAYEKAKAATRERQAEAARAEERWTQVANRLDAVQVRLRPNGSLTLEDWEHLLESAGL